MAAWSILDVLSSGRQPPSIYSFCLELCFDVRLKCLSGISFLHLLDIIFLHLASADEAVVFLTYLQRKKTQSPAPDNVCVLPLFKKVVLHVGTGRERYCRTQLVAIGRV